MKRSIVLSASILLFAGGLVAQGQWSAQQNSDTRVGPVYPNNQSYQFQSVPPGYSPYQFNAYTGRWDYVPVPYDTWSPNPRNEPYQFNANSGQYNYNPTPSPMPRDTGKAPAGPAKEDDSALWNPPPTTLPSNVDQPKTATFTGRIVSIRAVQLAGQPKPQLLLRLHTPEGAKVTVDVGDRLNLAAVHFDFGGDTPITVTGKLGQIDGVAVLFAEHFAINAKPGEGANHSATTEP